VLNFDFYAVTITGKVHRAATHENGGTYIQIIAALPQSISTDN
jgi:hypothetical protein